MDILDDNEKALAGLLVTDIQEMVNAIIVELSLDKPHKSYIEEKANCLYLDLVELRRMIEND